MNNSAPLLEARAISRAFPGVRALDAVDFDLARGEIHALMGENGAGKSTLIKILTGALTPDGGSVLLDGVERDLRTTPEAQAAGIWAVHQEISLLPNLSVTDNLFLGHQPTRWGLVRRAEMNRSARSLLKEFDLDIDVERTLASYSVAVRQIVAVARAVRADAKVLVLDEPTASLDAAEVESLFAILRRLAAEGTGIIFITHFLDQVYALADRITVLRNGQLIGTRPTSDLPRLELVSMMLGKGLEASVERKPRVSGSGKLLASFSGIGKKSELAPFDLDLREGEAVGAAGLLGSGRSETALLMFGAIKPDSGTIQVDGEQVRIDRPRDAIRLGFGFTPEERKTDGIVGALSVRDNIILALQARAGWWAKLPKKRQHEIAGHYIDLLGIKTPDADKPIEQLSGGNQQKAVLARWLATKPRLLILDEPTRGVDVGAHAEIIALIEKLRDEGMALYVISSEIEELAAYSDRVSVMRDRKQIGMIEGDRVSIGTIVDAIAGEAA